LGDLTALASLGLEGNQLSGTIPTELGNLTALMSLSLSWNQLSGCLPVAWKYVVENDLEQLDLPYCAAASSARSTGGDRDVLVALYLAADGDKWTNSDNWLSDAPINTWYGVTTDESGRVIELGLAYNNLSGTIPPELSNLTALTNLYLRWNQLSGTIPSELGNLTALTNLNLGWNQLSGTVPSELGNLASLDTLHLAGNRLSGCLPAVWKHVVENDLERLDLPYCAVATSAHSTDGDRDVLVALYLAADGDKWTNSDNWLSDAPINTWYGVTTDESGRVIELDLWYNNLSGTIPPELGSLTNLKALTLASNELGGTIPSKLGSLTNLESLQLWNNQLSGPIPPALGNLTNLEWLSFGDNQLEGMIPSELSRLNNLSILELEDNKLSGTIPPELGNLTRLTWLALWGNQLEGVIPPELGNLTNLTHLNLSENQLSGTIPSELGNLIRLEAWLSLDGNQLEGVIPSELSNLTNLKHLNLSENQLSGTIPSELSRLDNLETLELQSNQLSGAIPRELGNLTSLTRLYLHSNRLNGSIPPELGNLTNLWSLNLSENVLSGSIPSDLARLTGLRWLVLSENLLSGSIPSELDNLTNLFWLDLEDNHLIGTVPPQLGNLTNLDVWYLSGNRLDGCLPSGWQDVKANDFDELGLIFCITPSRPHTAATDKEALIALYRATGGDSWTYNSNWLSNVPLNTWYGVTTDEDGRVTKLELGYNGLSGTIPSELGMLVQLEKLSLHVNELSGEIPAEVGNLTNLTGLSFCCNNLSGTIPPELGNLTDLTYLSLNDNQLDGIIPPELGNLINLTSLSLGENRLYGTIPPELGRLTNLTELSLNSNQLHGTIPSELSKLTSLSVLWLDSNQLSGMIPSELDKLTKLLELSLLGNQIVGCVPTAWRHVLESDLEILGLPYCAAPTSPHLVAADRDALIAFYRSANGENWINNSNWLSDAPLNTWYGVTTDDSGRVTKLELGYNELSGTIPSELGTLDRMERLLLHGNALRGEIPPELGNFVNLTSLSLSENLLHGTIPRELGNLVTLAGLYLDSNQLHGTIPPEMGNLTNLAVLWLDSNQLHGTVPLELGTLTNLFGLSLSGNQLSGCVPAPWRNVVESDLEEIGLPYCAAPLPPSAAVPAALSSSQIFAKVSPAIAFVHTEVTTGSGILIEGNYILTNAHVVWPFHAARVVFPNGSAFDQVPLKGWDLLADVALLGPINAPTQPLVLHDGENIPIGSDVYLIGYLGEAEANPQPVTAHGVLSRLHQWELAAVTYFQIDTSNAGEQSGSALVSDTGDVIGISGFKIPEMQFALAASSTDLLPRIRQLLAGEAPSGLGDRRLPLEGGALRHVLTSESYWDAYIVNEPDGSAIEVALSGAGDAKFRIFDPFGNELTYTETTSFDFVTQSSGPHFLVFSQLSAETTTLTANRRFARFVDPDQGREILVGQSLPGSIDFPSDFDFFFLHLEKGEAVEVAARSALTDPSLGIMGLGSSDEELIVDDDSGGGLFGLDAKILFQAPYTGEYVLIIFDALGTAPGGYVISVARPQSMVVPTSQVPIVTIKTHINVRQGPSTNYPVIDTAAPGEQYVITGKNPGLGDWWQIDYKGRTAWVYAPLVTATDAENVQVVATPDP